MDKPVKIISKIFVLLGIAMAASGLIELVTTSKIIFDNVSAIGIGFAGFVFGLVGFIIHGYLVKHPTPPSK